MVITNGCDVGSRERSDALNPDVTDSEDTNYEALLTEKERLASCDPLNLPGKLVLC